MSLNLAVITTQVGLIASAAAFALFLDGIILTKKTGLTVAGGAIALEQSIEKRIVNLIEQSRNYAKVTFINKNTVLNKRNCRSQPRSLTNTPTHSSISSTPLSTIIFTWSLLKMRELSPVPTFLNELAVLHIVLVYKHLNNQVY